MSKPTLTVSGYRGIWGDTLTPDIARDFTHAFVQFLNARHGKTIIVGRDARPSGEEIVTVVSEVLTQAGFDVIDAGIIPTPTILLVIRKWGLSGGVIITASHNPAEYNGLKFVTSEGLFTNEIEVEEIKKYLKVEQNENILSEDIRPGINHHASQSPREPQEKYFHSAPHNPTGSIIKRTDAGDVHIDTILSHVDIDAIHEAKFNVVLDPINSAGATVTPKLLEELGCTTTVINSETTGIFAHKPEPLRENLTGLGDAVRMNNAHIGFAQDPDADRLVVVDEKGEVLNEEYTLALAVRAVMLKKAGGVVTNCSSSIISKQIAEEFGGTYFYTKVGEANVVEGIKTHSAIIGGEGNGGVIYPTINSCRDSLTGIALILELLAHEKKPLSEIIKTLPPITIAKDKITFDSDLETLYTKIEKEFPDGVVNRRDGLRLDFPNNAWLLIRPSNTEPIVRIMGEAGTESKIKEMIEKVKELIN